MLLSRLPQGSEDALRNFTSDLFAEPADSFTIIHAGIADEQSPVRTASPQSFTAFSRFQDAFVSGEPWTGIRELAKSLDATDPDEALDPQVALLPDVGRQRRPDVGKGENRQECNYLAA